ncbi:MAG TPA: hypothetical protein VMF29_09495, partial [Candidatus Edwardsbacteria bacterium]|nr:hypothetical protein [Candidatus Edwardsbacteria bacterium]
MQKLSKRTVGLVALGALWLASMAWFGGRQAGCQGAPAQRRAVAGREEWHGIYMQGQKIGYSSTFTQTLPAAAGGGLAVSNRALMRLNLMQTVQDVLTVTRYTMDSAYRLRDFDFKLSGAAQMDIGGRVVGNSIAL